MHAEPARTYVYAHGSRWWSCRPKYAGDENVESRHDATTSWDQQPGTGGCTRSATIARRRGSPIRSGSAARSSASPGSRLTRQQHAPRGVCMRDGADSGGRRRRHRLTNAAGDLPRGRQDTRRLQRRHPAATTSNTTSRPSDHRARPLARRRRGRDRRLDGAVDQVARARAAQPRAGTVPNVLGASRGCAAAEDGCLGGWWSSLLGLTRRASAERSTPRARPAEG
jgi:hypothetical protein